MTNILIIDIETAPKLAYVWRFYKENVGAKQVLEHGYIMSYAAKWLGEDKVMYNENRKLDDSKIVIDLINLLDIADIVIAHNAKRFDLPSINGRALVNGLMPPSPYKVVDTLIEARREFKFESNSLEYLAKVLGCTPKDSHKSFPGFELWLECMKGNEEAWEELYAYNVQDVVTLEEIYIKMRPWIRSHPNVAVYRDEDRPICSKCGSSHIQLRGSYHTKIGRYERFKCMDCGGWDRGRFNVRSKEMQKKLIVGAL